jgi:hypothetical protein
MVLTNYCRILFRGFRHLQSRFSKLDEQLRVQIMEGLEGVAVHAQNCN